MDFTIDFIHVGDGDAIIIWAREPGVRDYVFFVDGGNTGDGKKVIDHYEKYIEPNLQKEHMLGFVNSHPHADHINGLLELLEYFGSKIKFGIYNDPVECITEEHRERIHQAYLVGADPDITHLYETFEQVEKLNTFCELYKVKRHRAYREECNFLNGAFQLLSPSKDFYVNMVQYFTDVDFLKTVDFSSKPIPSITDDDDVKPCVIVDEVNDASPENLTGTVIQLTDSKNRKCILTSDAGVDSFDYMESEGFINSGIHLVQLPHHGSRRNISTAWIKKFNPKYFVASADGNAKHPRKAVVNCIKRNLADCKVYSTHVDTACISHCTNDQAFPGRGWPDAVPL